LSVTLDEDQELLRGAALLLTPCSLEATAAGTGITPNPEYLERLVDNLSTVSGISHSKAEDLIEATWDPGAFITISGALRRTAIKLSEIGSDLVLLLSGPQPGPAQTQAGRPLMMGKVSQTIPVVVNQIAYFVAGADITVTMAAVDRQSHPNNAEPAIAHALLQSPSCLSNGCDALTELCKYGIEINEELPKSRSRTATVDSLILAQ
jgi:aspartate ammonia-lyase